MPEAVSLGIVSASGPVWAARAGAPADRMAEHETTEAAPAVAVLGPIVELDRLDSVLASVRDRLVELVGILGVVHRSPALRPARARYSIACRTLSDLRRSIVGSDIASSSRMSANDSAAPGR